jgi:hypothetical protein
MTVDLRPGPLGGIGQAVHVLADVQPGAQRVEQGAVVGVGAELGAQLGLAEQHRVVAEVACQDLLSLSLRFEVRGLVGHPEPAGSGEITVDLLGLGELLDDVHGLAEGVVQLVGTLLPVTAAGLADRDGQALGAHAAVAPGRARGDLVLLHQDDPRALAGGVAARWTAR